MKIGLQTWGTDGDFFPFLALAVALKAAGHQVTIAYTSIDGKEYSDHPQTEGIELIKADGGLPRPQNTNPYAITAKPGSFREYTKLLKLFFEPFAEAMYTASEKLCMQSDVVIGHAVCHTLLTASQKHNVPRISLVLTPLIVKSKYVSPVGINLGPTINSILWAIGGFVATQTWFKAANRIREREGLPRVKSLQKELFTSDLLTIVGASQFITSRPIDWTENIQVSGFLNLPTSGSEWRIPEDLKAFLEAGEPPVFMTFGSCMAFDLEASTKLLIEAAKLSGKRTIIQSDWEQIPKPNDPNIYCIGHVPHSEVFPLCSLIVHHGGAGTTQASLLAGKPSVVVAHGFDQSYWGDELEKAGVADKTLLRRNTTPKNLSEAVLKILISNSFEHIAANLGKKMKTENGIQSVVKWITEQS